ncbi:MAG: glycosyltransferase, partial [Firmicutes bacterium]|nr:glycosyltransferase [Bacillota bacterium]
MIRIMHTAGVMNRAGQETFIMNIFRHIDRSRFQFEFFCELDGAGDYDEEILALGGKIHRMTQLQSKNPFKRRAFRKRNYVKFFSENSDIILHIHERFAPNVCLIASAAKKAGIQRIIVHSHSTSVPSRRWLHKLFKLRLNR